VTGDAPLILTLALDQTAQDAFDALRQQHFPPERNHLAAHVTLFHKLPAAALDEVSQDLAAGADRAPFAVSVSGLRLLGGGVAFDLQSPELVQLRADLAERWQAWLTPQDRQGFRPHVTVQNKVEPAQARALHARLSAGFAPWTAQAQGLLLWRYLGGPWAPVQNFPFAAILASS
jgi:2'-5' RNA ligase